MREVAQLLGESALTHATELVLLDPEESDGYVRDWAAPGFPPLRHIGYALQWFALALALFIIYRGRQLAARRGSAGMITDKTEDRRQGRLLVVVAILFFAPLGLSFYLYYGRDWRPGSHVNAGALIAPAIPSARTGAAAAPGRRNRSAIPQGQVDVFVCSSGVAAAMTASGVCTTRARCALALDRDMKRVQRVFIADADCCDMQALHAMHPDLIVIRREPRRRGVAQVAAARRGGPIASASI